jgi:hypothetical protein
VELGREPVTETVPAGRGPAPDGPAALGFGGIVKGGATDADDEGAADGVKTLAGALDTSTEAVVLVITVAGAWLLERPKSEGSVTPLSSAQVWGSTPSGQQKPWTRQNDPFGQGSRRGVSVLNYRSIIVFDRRRSYSLPSNRLGPSWVYSRCCCRRKA